VSQLEEPKKNIRKRITRRKKKKKKKKEENQIYIDKLSPINIS
jgi:hypothetical protein